MKTGNVTPLQEQVTKELVHALWLEGFDVTHEEVEDRCYVRLEDTGINILIENRPIKVTDEDLGVEFDTIQQVIDYAKKGIFPDNTEDEVNAQTDEEFVESYYHSMRAEILNM